MDQKLFRDPLYDYIVIDTKKDRWLLNLINCPEVQRLRYIHQLGVSHLTYPGATHTRFSHSLGVLMLMHQCVQYLEQTHGQDDTRLFEDGDQQALLAAALLHDVGHGPFSHVTEDIIGKHEEISARIITDSGTKVNTVLKNVNSSLPSKVGALISEKVAGPLWQKSLISSQLDVDRLDYLRRDALFSGAEYGHFDAFRIIHTMQVREHPRQGDLWLVWQEKTKYAIEEYIFSRFYMYQALYFHHTTRGFERILQKIFDRAGVLLEMGTKSFGKTILSPFKGFSFRSNAHLDLNQFHRWTDYLVLAQIDQWQHAKDEVLSDLSYRFLCRDGLACGDFPLLDLEASTRKRDRIYDYLRVKGYQHPEYYFLGDTAETSVYKPYRPAQERDDQSSVNSIILFDPGWQTADDTGFKEISHVPGLERLEAITGRQSSLTRYYYPKKHRKAIEDILRK